MPTRWIAVLALSFVGCGGTGDPSGDDTPPSDGGPGDDAPSSAKTGTILIEGTTEPIELTVAGAEFRAAASTGGTTRTDGACVIRTGNPTSAPQVGAGDMTITRGADVLMLEQRSDNGYSAVETSLLYTAGDVLAIAATGDVVPAFSKSVTYPQPITVTTPTPPTLGQRLTIDKTGFAVAWTGSEPVRLSITQDTTNVGILCSFTGTTSATVPASALADLVAGTNADVLIASTATSSLTAGDFEIDVLVLHATFFAVDGMVQ